MKTGKEIFLVPYAHLDTQWRWEYPTTIKKYIKNTLDESIAMFKKYPGHRFNFTGAIRYAMMKEYFPSEFEEVKKLIDEERWHLAGTCLDETDALIPSSESLIRNILYGYEWQKKEFGRSSRDYMIPDCFGFPGNMPTLMAHCGIQGFSSQKLTWGSAVGIPFEIGMWKGPDGSEIVSAMNPCRYDAHLELPIFINPDRLGRLKRLGKKNNIWKSFQYYGVGDIGGAPREGSIRRALASIAHYEKRGGDLIVRQGSADQFFSEVTEEERARMDRYEGDFLLTNHSAGTATSAAIMKRWNRKNEQLAFAGEEAALAAMLYGGVPYPTEKINTAWRLMIGSQMHDILPGTSTPTAYEYSQNDEVIALKTWSAILEDSAEAVAPYIKGDGEILIFNPLAEKRNDIVDVVLPGDRGIESGPVVLEDGEGNIVSGQVASMEEGRSKVSFIPELAPSSWTRFKLRSLEPNEELIVSDPVLLEETEERYVLENRHHRVTVTKAGALSSIICNETGRELLTSPLAYEFQKEKPMKFPAWNMDWKDRKKGPYKRIEGEGEVYILENSRARVKIQVKVSYGSSLFIREITLSSGSEIVELAERINWRETGCSLKLAFHTTVENTLFTSNWETSRTRRDINHKKIFEVPSRMWVDLSGREHGLSILEDSKYGWDHPDGSTIRMTLLYTPSTRIRALHYDQKSHDWGEHTIRYGIQGHRGDWSGADRAARLFNQPVRSFLVNGAAGAEKENITSFISLSSPQVGLMALKKCEDDDSVIVRLYERYGKDAETEVNFALPVEAVREVNGLEETVGAISHRSDGFSVKIGANGVKAIAVTLSSKKDVRTTLHEALALEYNSRLFGMNSETGEARIPCELTPEKIGAGGVFFTLKPDGDNNALRCDGQEIALAEGYNCLSLLAAADEVRAVEFQWLDREGNVMSTQHSEVSCVSGFAGQWDTRVWKRKPKHHLKHQRDYVWFNKCVGVTPGFINRQRLEWFSSHSHGNGRDMAYQYSYLYNIAMEIPDRAVAVRLPEDRSVSIAAATISQKALVVDSIQYLNDKFDV